MNPLDSNDGIPLSHLYNWLSIKQIERDVTRHVGKDQSKRIADVLSTEFSGYHHDADNPLLIFGDFYGSRLWLCRCTGPRRQQGHPSLHDIYTAHLKNRFSLSNWCVDRTPVKNFSLVEEVVGWHPKLAGSHALQLGSRHHRTEDARLGQWVKSSAVTIDDQHSSGRISTDYGPGITGVHVYAVTHLVSERYWRHVLKGESEMVQHHFRQILLYLKTIAVKPLYFAFRVGGFSSLGLAYAIKDTETDQTISMVSFSEITTTEPHG